MSNLHDQQIGAELELPSDKEDSQKGHPKGLYVLFATEFWERFSYYGMRAIFALYMTKMLLLDKAASSTINGTYTGLVYLTPLIGGYVADRYWGNRKSIFVGGLLMALGQFLMFFSASLSHATDKGAAISMMWAGLTFLIFGNGFFKTNISTMVGQLYKENDERKDAAYTIFYMGINAGAFLAPFVCGTLGEKFDYKWGFLSAGIGMLVSLVIFYFTKNKYVVAPDGRQLGIGPNKLTDTSATKTEVTRYKRRRRLQPATAHHTYRWYHSGILIDTFCRWCGHLGITDIWYDHCRAIGHHHI